MSWWACCPWPIFSCCPWCLLCDADPGFTQGSIQSADLSDQLSDCTRVLSVCKKKWWKPWQGTWKKALFSYSSYFPSLVFSFVFSQWPMTLLEKLLLLFLLCGSVLSSCVFYLLSSCCHGASWWQCMGFRQGFLNGYIDPGTQYADTVLSVRAGGAEARLSGEAGQRTTCLEYHISTHHLLCVCVSPFSERLRYGGAVWKVCAHRPSLGKCAGRCGVWAPLHARRRAPTPEGKRTRAAARDASQWLLVGKEARDKMFIILSSAAASI